MSHYECKKCLKPMMYCICELTTKKPMSVHECKPAPEVVTTAIKSDGGSSKYYQLEVKVPTSNVMEIAEGVTEVKLETGDVIRALVDNDFDLGNVIKACRRIHQAKKGEGKQGTDVEYDCKKIEYFLKEWYKAYQMEQV